MSEQSVSDILRVVNVIGKIPAVRGLKVPAHRLERYVEY